MANAPPERDDGPSRPALPAIEWPEPTLDARIPDQAPYPLHKLPPVVQDAVDALYELTGANPAMAGTALLAGLAGVAQLDYVVQGIGPDLPLQVYAICAAPTGQRKSSTLGEVKKIFDQADTAVGLRWRDAKAWWSHADKAARDDNPDRAPARSSPQVLRSDATIEALMQCLAEGRPAQWQYLTELVTLTDGWSGKSANRPKTMHDYAALWDGTGIHVNRVRDQTDYTITGRYLSCLFFGQPGPFASWVMDPAAANGYAQRLLVSYQADLEDLPPDLSRQERADAKRRFNGIERIMAEALRRQNDGVEFAGYRTPERANITLDLEAHGMMRSYLETEYVLVATANGDGDTVMAGWHNRSTEHAQRIAGLLTALRGYQTVSPGSDLTMTPDEAQAGIDLADWYGNELRRVASMSMATQEANDALIAWRAIGDAVYSGAKGVSTDAEGELVVGLRSLLTLGWRSFRTDPDRRNDAIRRLETEGLVEPIPGQRGKWLVHPAARE